jgi:class 3 adenylate cyclase/pimeloyl-ACP methyl ester carboxylesterase
MDKPQTKFTRAGDVAVAYQVVGDGPVDLVYASGWLSNIEIVWEHPGYNKLLSLLSEKCRLILFDKRGTGMSDRDVGAPTLEERTDDIRAVMDAAGSERASIFGVSEGGSMTMMFAAIYPERVSSIILAGCYPCKAWRPDWPHGRRRGEVEADINKIRDNWGEFTDFLEAVAPSVSHDPDEQAFINKLLVQSGSPSTAINITRLNNDLDTRPILSSVQAPALVLHSAGDKTVSLEEAKYMADNMPNGELKVLDRQDHLPWIGDVEEMAREIVSFATDFESGPTEDRILAAILMTDIVRSTETTVRLGDAEWHKLIEAHDAAAARSVARYGGTLIKTLGDGILATFTGPSRAVACAQHVIKEAEALGLSVRAGVHIGECVRRGNDIAGVAVTTAARILDSTAGGECRVSSTVRDLVAGSGLLFEAAGSHKLRGIPGDWEIYTALRG